MTDRNEYAMERVQRCSLCREAGHNRTSCVQRLQCRMERVNADLVLKEAEVDRLQRVLANLTVEATIRII